MRTRISLFVISLVAVTNLCIAQTDAKPDSMKSAGNKADQMLIDNSRAVWTAYKNRDVAKMKALTAKEYAANTQAGPSSLPGTSTPSTSSPSRPSASTSRR